MATTWCESGGTGSRAFLLLHGLGATAALVSDRPRKGEHRFHIAFANAAGIAHCTCVMAKGRRDRIIQVEENLLPVKMKASIFETYGGLHLESGWLLGPGVPTPTARPTPDPPRVQPTWPPFGPNGPDGAPDGAVGIPAAGSRALLLLTLALAGAGALLAGRSR